jgi:hypothetical protein
MPILAQHDNWNFSQRVVNDRFIARENTAVTGQLLPKKERKKESDSHLEL